MASYLAERILTASPLRLNEVLEIATTLGRLLAQKEDQTAIAWLRKANEALNHTAPEVELAFVRIAPAAYLADFGSADQAKRKVQETILLDWRAASGVAAGLGEIAALPDSVKNKSELAASRANSSARDARLPQLRSHDKHACRRSF